MVDKVQFVASLAVVSAITSVIGDVGIINSGIDGVSFANLGPLQALETSQEQLPMWRWCATASTGLVGAGLWFGARSGAKGSAERNIGKTFMLAAGFMAWGMADYMTDISEQMAQGDAYQERMARINEAQTALNDNYDGAVDNLDGVRETNSDGDPRNDLGVQELADANTREAVAAADARAALSGEVVNETQSYLATDNSGYSALERASVTTTFMGSFVSTLGSIFLLFKAFGDSRYKARNFGSPKAPAGAAA